jgi:UDP-N-acetylmuramoylalanine--D-glutamate ligase
VTETVLVEGFEPDAIEVARLLAREGRTVRHAGDGEGPGNDAAAQLRAVGIAVEPSAELDRRVGAADIAYLDVWTPETAPRVRALREGGCRLTCAAELVLERAGAPVLGVTGTAGKSTTTSFAVQLLRAAGLAVQAAETGRLGNLWATADVVAAVAAGVPADLVALELTSSHLAFMQASPSIAVITSFWPDHVELHGSLAAYRRAKEAIVRGQRPEDAVVAAADDPAVASFAELTPARRFWFSESSEVDEGAFLRSGAVVVRSDTGEQELGPSRFGPAATRAVLAAAAATAAVGVPAEALAGCIEGLEPPPHRMQRVARVAGAEVVDDGMAATPVKTAAALSGAADGSVVLIAGGLAALASGSVHASPDEQALLGAACDEIARAARLAVLFGPASPQLELALRARGVAVRVADSLEQAVGVALGAAAGAGVVLFSPMFPVDAADRVRFAELVRSRP